MNEEAVKTHQDAHIPAGAFQDGSKDHPICVDETPEEKRKRTREVVRVLRSSE